MVVNEEILSILQNLDKENCYLWTSANKLRAEYLLRELDLAKYFNKVVYDDKKDLNSSLKRLKDITKSNVFLIFEDNEALFKRKGFISKKNEKLNDFLFKIYLIFTSNL